ncbi:MAG: glycosyltransferase family 4 protein [Vicinamibacterales bacterium]
MSARLRLCFYGWSSHIHVRRWVEAFVERGHDVSVISVGKDTMPIQGARVVPLRSRRHNFVLQSLEFRALLKWLRPDVVHAHWAPLGYLPAICGTRPLVVSAWGSDVYMRHEADAESVAMLTTGLQAADLVTCDSKDLAREITTLGVAPGNVRVVQWGVDLSLFAPDPAGAAALRTSLGIPDNALVLFSPRHFAPIYDIESIVRAIPLVRRTQPNVVFILKDYRGTAEYRQHLRELATSLGVDDVVRWVFEVGYGELPAYYSLAAATISVPVTDATPMSVLEAAACGSVPIVSDLPSLREWITPGHNGFIVPKQDPESLAAAILRLSAGDSTSMREANVRLVRDEADHAAHMAAMEQLYASLASSGRTSAA